KRTCGNRIAPEFAAPSPVGTETMIERSPSLLVDRRLALLRDVAERYAGCTKWSEIGEQTARAIEANQCGIAFVSVYIVDPLRTRAALVGAAGIPGEHRALPSTIRLDRDCAWSVAATISTRVPHEAPEGALGGLPPGLGGRRARAAITMPIVP